MSNKVYMYTYPIEDNVMGQTFIKGIKPDIQAEISREKLVGLQTIMNASLTCKKEPPSPRATMGSIFR